MTDHDLELRLLRAARELDRDAPSFDAARLHGAARGRRRTLVPVVCAVLLAAAALAPTAISSFQRLFDVDEVTELGPLEPGVAAPFPGRAVPVDAIQGSAPFHVLTVASLGAPDAARVRDDVMGGMVTLVYGPMLLTQWRTTDLDARIALVPTGGAVEDVAIGGAPALWIEGSARGTFTLTGADGTIHREAFEVSPGVLLWRDRGRELLLQGASSRDEALGLAADVRG
jgi:hypothetical protein